MSQTAIGLLNIAILGLSLGATILIPTFLYFRKKIDDHSESIQSKVDNKLDEMDKRIAQASAELLPAFKNGGIVTPAMLREHMSTLERILSDKVEFMNKRLDIHNESSSAKRGLSEERLIEIIRNEIARKR